MSGLRRGITPALLLALAGCGGGGEHHPVKGTVALEDGTPVTQGIVIFERLEGGPPLAARGEIKPDGSYALSTHKPGDGVPTGKYRVLIGPNDLSDTPDEEKKLPYDLKYLKFTTSGLRFDVKAGPNDIPLKLTPPPPAAEKKDGDGEKKDPPSEKKN